MENTLKVQDLNTGQTIDIRVSGHGNQRRIDIGQHQLSLADGFRLVELLFLTGDLGGEDCLVRQTHRKVLEYQEGEGCGVGAKRLRPSHERLMAGTATPHR